MKRLKATSLALLFASAIVLSACGGDPVLEEIIDGTELNPTFDTGDKPAPPTSTKPGGK